ncbi:MAG: hypothetical protein M3068_14820 [Gemmatimonadota bacterium]|nr:hypothetical protein [Gemmatimonadota bacterium]
MNHQRPEVASGEVREFVDASGVGWRVHEMPAGRVPGSRGDNCLILESDGACRRLWNYPSTWFDLPVSDLLRIAGTG